jgi:hypothetical protein
VLDSTHCAYWLRRLFRYHDSRNLLGTSVATGAMRHRIVFLGHADAASTGLLFTPWLVSLTAKYRYPRPLNLLRKQMLIGVGSFLLFALVEAVDWLFTLSLGESTIVFATAFGLTLVWSVAMLLNLEVAVRWRVVPGANDNLTGCAALPILARRLLVDQPADVEFVFAVTGCEETGAGGANALVAEKLAIWDPKQTTIIGVDSISGGELRCYREGEFWPHRTAPWLRKILDRVAEQDERFGGLLPYDPPAGMTDYAPFRSRGYDGLTLCRIDPSLGTPCNYHRMSDTLENLDLDSVAVAIDAVEVVARAIMKEMSTSKA